MAAWCVSSAAMMLPSALPFIRAMRDGGVGPGRLVVGYLAVWSAFGAAAYLAMDVVAFSRAGAGVGLAAAGAYQLTPLKHSCLRRCRSPFHFLLHRRNGLAIGLEYGTTCLFCCFGLMLALLVLGMASIAWMAVVATAIAAEKLLRIGPRVAYATAGALLVAGTVAILA
jgi:predicted metal-binding membrane protein